MGYGNTLRFGWAGHGHAAINASAYTLLATRPKLAPFTSFIIQNQADIDWQSSLVEREPLKDRHFINSERTWNPQASKRLLPEERLSDQVFTFFRKRNETKRMGQLDRGLSSSCLLKESKNTNYPPENVYQSTLNAYHQLVNQLRSSETTELELEVAIGTLVHYAADLNQPMHTSQSYDWLTRKKKGVRTKGAHYLFENHLVPRKDSEGWHARIQRDLMRSGIQLTPLNLKAIQNKLKQGVRTGYQTMFELVALDKKERTRPRQSHGDYMRSLKLGWKPIAEKQMKASSHLIAVLLLSAYHEAGVPRLDQLG